MPWKFLGFLVVLGLFVIFAGINIENTSDISFGFVVINDVPIFLSLSLAFILGAILMLPFSLNKYFKKGRKKPKQEVKDDSSGGLFKRSKKSKKKDVTEAENEITEEEKNSPEN